jgi:hypothetical protein
MGCTAHWLGEINYTIHIILPGKWQTRTRLKESSVNPKRSSTLVKWGRKYPVQKMSITRDFRLVANTF